MAAHRSVSPAQITLLNPCISGDLLPEDNADPLARLLDALPSVLDIANLSTVLQTCLPSLVDHNWAALLLNGPDPQVWVWETHPPTPIEQHELADLPAALEAMTQLVQDAALSHAVEPLQHILQSLGAMPGRFAVVPLPLLEGAAALCLSSAAETAWNDEESQALLRICGGLKLALQQALLRATIQDLNRGTYLLDGIRSTIAHTLDLDALVRQVVEQISLRYGYPLVSLYLLEDGVLHCKHQIGYPNVIRRVPLTTGVMALAVRQRQTICLADVRSNPEFMAAIPGIVSEIAVPLQSEHTVYGVLNIESTQEYCLGPRDQIVLEAVAVEISIAIERAMLYTAAHRQAQQLAVIDQLRGAIASQPDLNALGMTIVRLLRDQLNFEFVALFLIQDDVLCLRAWCGAFQRIQPRIKIDQSLNGLCIRKRRPLLIKDVQSEPEWVSVANGIRWGIYVPLVWEQTVLGTLSIESRTILTESDFEIVTSLREQIAAALEQSRQIEEAQRAREREAFLSKLLTTINQTSPDHWPDVWAQLAVQLGALLESDQCAIGTFAPDQTMTLNVWQPQRNASAILGPRRIPLSDFDPAVLDDFRHGRSLYINDLTLDPDKQSALRQAMIADGLVALAAVPVIVDDELIALLAVFHHQPWPWEREDKALLEGVAQHLTVALRQANLRMQEAQRRHELELVYQTALDINAHHDLEPVLQAIVERACALLDADCAMLYLLPNEEEAELRVGVNIPPRLLGSRASRHQGLLKRTLGATSSYVVPDYSSWEDRDPLFDYMPFRATLGVPLLVDRRPIGVLIVAYIGSNKQFSAREHRLIEMLAAQAAQAIETAQLLEDICRWSIEMEAVYENALTLSSDLDLQQVLQLLADRAQALIGCAAAGLNLFDRATQELELVVGVNLPEHLLHTRIKLGEGVVGCAAQIQRTIRLHNYQEWPNPAPLYQDLPWLSVMAIPFVSSDRLLGVLGLAHTNPQRRFTARDQQLMELFASQAAQAVEHARRFERERILRSDAERSLDEMQAVLEELEHTNERMGRLEKMRLLGELASEVAHDFNNALTSVLGNSQLLLLDESDPARIETLSAIEAAARDSVAMIKRLQEFGRSHQEPYTELVDINMIVRDAVTMMQTRWRELIKSNIRLEATLSVRGSTSELRRVLMNLIVNAIDAMPEGGTLAILTKDVGDAVRITVIDTGVGMPAEIATRVFDPFFTTKAVGMGTGLGLAICHQVIVRHGGTIGVESTPGVGTTFTIHLPVGVSESRSIAPPENSCT